VEKLKSAGGHSAKVGRFTSTSDQDKDNANPISIRGSKFVSPYEGSYANYIAEAIKQELSIANKLDAKADTEGSGTLLKNNIDTSGINVGTADITARFIVEHNGQTLYDGVKAIHHEFPSSFAGAVAVPRARQEYSIAVQRLLASLYADQAFIAAFK